MSFLVAVDRNDYEAALKGDRAAMARVRDFVDGLCLYEHGFPVEDDQVVLTLTEMIEGGFVDAVVIDQIRTFKVDFTPSEKAFREWQVMTQAEKLQAVLSDPGVEWRSEEET